MYAITIESPGGVGPIVRRRMSSNNAKEILPVLKAIGRAEFGMGYPLALNMGNGVYRVFHIYKPWWYARATIVNEAAK